jgi:long-chain acyl-CoA synthetase
VLVHRYLEDSATRSPDAIALVADDQVLTFAQLDTLANAVSNGLLAAGVRRGDRVAVYLDNRAETVIAVFAILKAGAAFLMVNPSTKPERASYLLRHAQVSAVILSGTRVETLADRLEGVPSLRAVVTVGPANGSVSEKAIVAFNDLQQERAEGTSVAPSDQDLAALLYTSGSTGDPKGVMLTHSNICSAIDSIVEYLELRSSDRILNVLPLSFGYGLTQLFSTIKVGGRLVLERGMTFPHVTLTKMATERVTGFAMVPTICSVLLGLDLSKYDLSSLRYITNAGAGLPVPIVRRMRQTLPHVKLVLMYGQTECLRVTYLDPSEVDRRPDSVGRGMPNQEVWVADENGDRVAPDEIGELIVRGPHVMRGYWRMPEETAERVRPGRHDGERLLHTGDLFRMDAEGYLYFVARSDDIIKSKGEKVSPREIENVLFRLSDIEEAVVFGVEHAVWGEAVKALIVLRAGATLTEREVQRHCAQFLEDFKVPSHVEFRSELPKTDNGKIHKSVLRSTTLGHRKVPA